MVLKYNDIEISSLDDIQKLKAKDLREILRSNSESTGGMGIRSFRLRVVSPTVCSPTNRVDSPTSYMSVRLRVNRNVRSLIVKVKFRLSYTLI